MIQKKQKVLRGQWSEKWWGVWGNSGVWREWSIKYVAGH